MLTPEDVPDTQEEDRLPNARHERFCQLFVLGDPAWSPDRGAVSDTRGNAARAYVRAGYAARGAFARAAASRLLREPETRARVSQLRGLEERLKSVYLRRWESLLPDAQQVLVNALEGKDVTTQQFQAAREVIHQAIGPTRFRFGVEEGSGTDNSLNVTLWSGKNRDLDQP